MPAQSRHRLGPSTAAAITPTVSIGESSKGEFTTSTGDSSPIKPNPPPFNPVKAAEKHPLEYPSLWCSTRDRLRTASKRFPRERYGIAPWVPVRPLLVGDKSSSRTYLVEYPAGNGTYCFWDAKHQIVWRIVAPAQAEDLLACIYRADYDALYTDLLLPIRCDAPLTF